MGGSRFFPFSAVASVASSDIPNKKRLLFYTFYICRPRLLVVSDRLFMGGSRFFPFCAVASSDIPNKKRLLFFICRPFLSSDELGEFGVAIASVLRKSCCASTFGFALFLNGRLLLRRSPFFSEALP